MTEIIQQWIVKKLGLPVSFNRGADRLRQELSNGHLIGEILRKYHLISDDQCILLTDSVCHHDREKNMNILRHWLLGMSFEIDANELVEIRQGKPGAALTLLYRMYLWLEGPGSQPGIKPRQKSQDMAVPSVDTIEGRENWISYVTDRYTKEPVKKADEGITFEDFLKDQKDWDRAKRKSSLVVNAASETDAEEAVSLEDSESFPELQSAEFLEGLKESLPYNEQSFEDKPKLVVSRVSVVSEDEHELDLKKSTPNLCRTTKISTISTENSDYYSEPYIEVDDKGLSALECGQLPSFYIRNHPFGTANEKLQAGNLYFHSKAMMILDEQRTSAKREFDLPKLSRLPCRNNTYVGAYEEALMYRQERKRKRSLLAMENTLNEINKFEEKLQENSGNSISYEEFPIKIYPNGRGDWSEASSKINALKSRRRQEKMCFQKRCSTRKLIAAALAKSNSCEMSEELDKTIHSKLITHKSKQEIWLAEYCTASHIEKRAFLDHIKYEEEQLLSMAMTQMYKEYLHKEQLEIIKGKVDKITEECDEQIMNAVQSQKRQAQFIMDIKFCEEIFTVILKTAIQYSNYRSEYGSDPPTALVAEWRDSFYLGSCVTMVKKFIKKDEKSRRKPEDYAEDHAKRCKKKKHDKKEKEAMKNVQKKSSKSSVTSLKSKGSSNSQLKGLSTIMEYVEEEESPMDYPLNLNEKRKKKKHSIKKGKHKDLHKTGSNESKTSNHSGVKKSGSDILDATIESKIQKANKKRNESKFAKKAKTSIYAPPQELKSDSKNVLQETASKVKKRKKSEGKKDSKDLTLTEENQANDNKKKGDKDKEKLGEKPGKTKPIVKVKAGKGDKKAEPKKAAGADNDEEEEGELPEVISTNENKEPGTEKETKTKKAAAKPKKPKKNN